LNNRLIFGDRKFVPGSHRGIGWRFLIATLNRAVDERPDDQLNWPEMLKK
jgi:hypothetical protein